MWKLSVSIVVVCGLLLFSSGAAFADIIEVSIPVDSDDATSHPSTDDVWSVSAPPFPLDITTGIGYLINPTFASGQADFSRHDHVYSTANVPDPTRAVVTYKFDTSTVVDQLEIIQHTNGITRVEGFVGDSLGSLTSIGSIFGTAGDVTGANLLTENSSHVFDFNNTTAGVYFQFVIRKTSLNNGWATYRAFPRLADDSRIPAAVIPEPSSIALCGLGLLGLLAYKAVYPNAFLGRPAEARKTGRIRPVAGTDFRKLL